MTYQSTWRRTFGGRAKLALSAAVVAGVMAFSAPGHAVTIDSTPATLNFNSEIGNSLSAGDAWLIEINGTTGEAGGFHFIKFTATQDLGTIALTNLNPPTGYTNPFLEWHSRADGDNTLGTSFASVNSAQLNSGSTVELLVSFALGDTKYLRYVWEGVNSGPFAVSNWDTNLAAIPLPAGLVLFLSGLVGIGFLGRYKAKRQEPAVA